MKIGDIIKNRRFSNLPVLSKTAAESQQINKIKRESETVTPFVKIYSDAEFQNEITVSDILYNMDIYIELYITTPYQLYAVTVNDTPIDTIADEPNRFKIPNVSCNDSIKVLYQKNTSSIGVRHPINISVSIIKANELGQSGQSMLVEANQRVQGVLSLLG